MPAPGSKRREYKGTGKLRSNISKAEDVVSRMMKQYFDPLAKIAHHVCGLGRKCIKTC